MNPYNQRKEPTFGESSQANADKVENIENTSSVEKPTDQKAKLGLSLHSKAAPGHTFTPTLKRPADTSQTLLSLEEQAMLKQNSSENTTGKVQNGGFAFAPVKENSAVTEPEDVAKLKSEPVNNAEPEKTATSTIERVIPAAAAPAAKAVVEKVPSKYRRLLIVLLLLLALLLAFFLLKPKTPETVENLQQGSNLPIEFRPVDEEEAKRAEAEAKALQEAQQAAQQAAAEQPAQQSVATENAQATEQTQVVPTTTTTPANLASQSETEQPVVAVPAQSVSQETRKPVASGSVIHQPETANKPVAAKPSQTVVAQPKPQVKAETAKPQVKVETKPAPVKEVKAAPVVTAQPVKIANGVVSIKTMIVPKGVSLMQVFRDHNLNISDVNAMSKVNNIVSNLKAGEKITVYLDKDDRVVEMIIGSGGRFIRQANGTYIYK